MKNFVAVLKILKYLANPKLEKQISKTFFRESIKISTAESCTGGLISSRLTDIAGSSNFVTENFITYSNSAKIELLGVSEETLANQGAISAQCALEMAEGLYKKTKCDIALSITGVAGPDKSEDKPVGLVFVGLKSHHASLVEKFELYPHYKRRIMKYLFSQKALELLQNYLSETYPADSCFNKSGY